MTTYVDNEQEYYNEQQQQQQQEYNNTEEYSNTEITETIGDTNSNISDYPEDNESHRTKLIKEIYTTEKSYNQHLNNAVNFYLEPLVNSQPAILENHMLQSIFSNIEEIRDISTAILNDLDRILFTEQSDNVCGPFLSRQKQFQSFITYGKNQGNSIETIQKLIEKKPSFSAFLVSVRDLNGHQAKLDLNAFLITPIQRLPRYKMLFSELLKNTEQTHSDYQQIEQVLQFVTKTTQCVNEEIRKQENKAKVELIQNSLVGGPRIITDNRLFVREGCLMKVCRKSPKPRWFFLFTDALMYTSFNPNSVSENVTGGYTPPTSATHTTYTFHRLLLLSEINKIKDVKDRDNQKNAFQIVSSSQKSFTVYAETAKEKNNWLSDFKEILEQKKIEENSSGGYEHTLGSDEVPVWVPDREASKCMFCNDSFTIINRRHHCRNCGKVVCGSCSNGKKLIPHVKKNKPVRVCIFCFDYISINEKEQLQLSASTNSLGNSGGTGSTVEVGSKYNTISKLNSILERKRSNSNVSSFLPMSPEGSTNPSTTTKENSHATLKKKLFGSSKDKDKRENSLPIPTSNSDIQKDYNRTQSEPYLIMKNSKGMPLPGTSSPGFVLPPTNNGGNNSPSKPGKETLKFHSPEFIKPKLPSSGSTQQLNKPHTVPNVPLPPLPATNLNENTSGSTNNSPTVNMITPTNIGTSNSTSSLPPINPNTAILRRTNRSNSQPVPPPISSLPLKMAPKSESKSSITINNKPQPPIPTNVSSNQLPPIPPPTHSPSSDNILLPSLPKNPPPKPPQRSPSSSSLNTEPVVNTPTNIPNVPSTSSNSLPKLITRTQPQPPTQQQNNVNNVQINVNSNQQPQSQPPPIRPRSNSNSNQQPPQPQSPPVIPPTTPNNNEENNSLHPPISFTTVKRQLPTPPTSNQNNQTANNVPTATVVKRPLPTPPITQ